MKQRYDDFIELAHGLWSIQFHRIAFGIHQRTRMDVVDVGGGALLLYSPVPIDDALADRLAKIGHVEHIVAPNRWHHLFAGHAKQRYSNAKLWGAPGLQEKRKDLAFDAVLNGDPFGHDLATVFMAGTPTVNEHVMFHRPSKTLLCCDFLMNVHDEETFLTRTFYRAYGIWRQPAQSRGWKSWTKDRHAAKRAVEQLMSFDIERIVMAHGDIIERAGRDVIATATSWLR